MITLLGAKNSRVIKDLSTVVAFCYLVSLNTFLLFVFASLTCFWKIIFTKKSMKLERFFCKDKSSHAIRDVTCDEVLITLVNLCDKRVSVCPGCNGPVKNNGLPIPPPYYLVAAKMHREYFKDGKKQMSWPSNVFTYFTRFHKCISRILRISNVSYIS